MVATDLLSDASAMNAAPSTHRPHPKDLILPVTRLVSTLSMTVQNGQLVARPRELASSAG